jgi:RNA polymerase sigma-70 factor (ECF subfamily)
VNTRIREQAARRQSGTLSGFEEGKAAPEAETGSPDPAQRIAEQTDLSRALEQLGDEEKNIVLISVIGGFTSREIADMTGLRPGSVRSKCSRSLAKLRDLLSD